MIKATCGCGATLKAKPSLAGQRVKCPSCRQSLTVPSVGRETDSLRFSCECGKSYRVSPQSAGRSAKCSACGVSFKIPKASAPTPQISNQKVNNANVDLLASDSRADAFGLDVGEFDDRVAPSVTIEPTGDSPPNALSKPQATTPSPSPVSQRRKLKRAAGFVAIAFGLLQAVFHGVLIIRYVIAIAAIDAIGLQTLFQLAPTILFLVLGVWFVKLGTEIVLGNLNAVGRASQASMVYIAIFIILILFWAFSMIPAFLEAPGVAFFVVAKFAPMLLLRCIFLLPPAFIMYVENKHPSRE